jgi:hypothetical protein
VMTEGSLQFVQIARGNRAVEYRLPARLHVAPGTYLLRSSTRTCSGDCSNLDPASQRCVATVAAPARVVVTTYVKADCRIHAAR